jgi:hypothetical protein
MTDYYFFCLVYKDKVMKVELTKNNIIYFTSYQKKNSIEPLTFHKNIEYDVYLIRTGNKNIFPGNVFYNYENIDAINSQSKNNKLIENYKVLDHFKYKDLYDNLLNQIRTKNCIYKFKYIYNNNLKILNNIAIIS